MPLPPAARHLVCFAAVGTIAACGRVSFTASSPDAMAAPDSDGASVTYGEAVLASSPLAYYHFDETTGATLALDASGHGHDAEYITNLAGMLSLGRPGAVPGSTAVSLVGEGNAGNGGESYVLLPSSAFAFGADFTVEGWL